MENPTKIYFDFDNNRLVSSVGSPLSGPSVSPNIVLGTKPLINIQLFDEDGNPYTGLVGGITAQLMIDDDYVNYAVPLPMGSSSWTLTGEGTAEYSKELTFTPTHVYFDDTLATEGDEGELAISEWAYNATDQLLHVRLATGYTPGIADMAAADWVQVGVTAEYKMTLTWEPTTVYINDVEATPGTITSLAEDEWGYDADTDELFVRLAGDADPGGLADGYVTATHPDDYVEVKMAVTSPTRPYVECYSDDINQAGTWYSLDSIDTVDATPTAGGTGYEALDILTLNAGTGGRVQVLTVTDGAVTSIGLYTAGSGYTVADNLGVTGGQGTGCKIEITAITTGLRNPSILEGELSFRLNANTTSFLQRIGTVEKADSTAEIQFYNSDSDLIAIKKIPFVCWNRFYGSSPDVIDIGASNYFTKTESDARYGGGVVTDFLDLDDTPANYAGAASYDVKVNAAANGVEFVVRPSYITADGLTGLSGDWDVGEFDITAKNVSISGTFTDGTATIVGGVITTTGNITIDSDASALILGDGQDASIYHDGTNLVVDILQATTAVSINPDGDDTDFVFGSEQLDDVGTAAQDSRMFFDKGKGAFRAGRVPATEWDAVNVGNFSAAFGYATTASGAYSTASGFESVASGDYSTACGRYSDATGDYSVALGNSDATGDYSVAIGQTATASGLNSVAFGQTATASGLNSVAFGTLVTASGVDSVAIGNSTIASATHAWAFGDSFTNAQANSFAIGFGQKDFAVQSGQTLVHGILAAGDISGVNYVMIAADGELTLHGTARVTKEIVIGAAELGNGTVPPTATLVGNYLTQAFTKGDDAVISIHVPPDWTAATALNISVDWATDEGYADNNSEIRWNIIWSALAHGGTEALDFSETTIDGGDVQIPANAKSVTRTSIGAIAGGSVAAGDEIGLRLKWVAIVDGYELAAKEPLVTHLVIEYTADKLGTAT